jgi:hypothetical protein
MATNESRAGTNTGECVTTNAVVASAAWGTLAWQPSRDPTPAHGTPRRTIGFVRRHHGRRSAARRPGGKAAAGLARVDGRGSRLHTNAVTRLSSAPVCTCANRISGLDSRLSGVHLIVAGSEPSHANCLLNREVT